MKDIDSYVDRLDYLAHDYSPERDDAMAIHLIELIGDEFPIAVLEQAIKYYRAKATDIEAKVIPDMLMEQGLSEATTTTGIKVSLKTEYTVKVVDQEKMAKWVEANGGEGLYKRSFSFEKGDDVSGVIEAIDNLGLSCTEKLEIHPQTLKKFVKDLGDAPPEDAGKLSLYTHAVVKK